MVEVPSLSDGPYTAFAGRRVLITGHTGFKGSWLAEWLVRLGAEVHGVALEPESEPSLFHLLKLPLRMKHIVCDIRDRDALNGHFADIGPEFIFHLAAQSLVGRGYREPVNTWSTNVLGTLHVLEAARLLKGKVSVVSVTTDKVYRNREWEYPYREEDELGGRDPYSASKAACEIAVRSWRASFGGETKVRVATARAGNAVGAGDYSEDRLVPDCYRAWAAGKPVCLRKPSAVRPWQHVLEPLSGYLQLALHLQGAIGSQVEACNFGPGFEAEKPVREVVRHLASLGTGRGISELPDEKQPHEAEYLALSVERARVRLGWRPVLSLADTLLWTDCGYVADPSAVPGIVNEQLRQYNLLRSTRNDHVPRDVWQLHASLRASPGT